MLKQILSAGTQDPWPVLYVTYEYPPGVAAMVGAKITISGSSSKEVDHGWDIDADGAMSPHET